MLAIKPTRTFTCSPKADPDIVITFEFNSEEDAIRKKGETSNNSFYRLIRSSIVSIDGLVDVDSGEPILKVTPAVQKTVFSWIINNDNDLLNDILTAYAGITPKNLESGVQQSQSGTGTQDSATDVN